MNLQISSEIVCKANGRDFWLLAEKANKDKAKMKKPRPKTQKGGKRGGWGEGVREAWPNQPVAVTPESKWPQNTRLRTRTKFLKCFHVPSQLGTQYPCPLFLSPLPFPAACSSRLSRCAARQLAMPTMTSRTTLGPFALLYYTRIIFKSQLGSPSIPPLGMYSWKGLEKQFWKFISLILIRCKSFAFPLCAICVSDMDIAQQGGRSREGEGVWGTGGVANNYFFRFGQLVPF